MFHQFGQKISMVLTTKFVILHIYIYVKNWRNLWWKEHRT